MTTQTWLVVLMNGRSHRFTSKQEADHFAGLFPEGVRGVWEEWI